jgi:hypothetical protein
MDAYKACEKKSVNQVSHLMSKEAAEVFRREFQCLTFRFVNLNVAEQLIEAKMNNYVGQSSLPARLELVNDYNQLTKPGLLPNLSKASVLPDGTIVITPNKMH